MKKRCGGCRYWIKARMLIGLCDKNDWACDSDYVCPEWKGKKYKRVNIKEIE